MKQDFMFTSESVTEGHPDKLCDQISDAIVDHFLEQDPCSRVIAECAVSISVVFIAARFGSDAVVDFPNVARTVIQQIGYNESEFNNKTCSILTSLKEMPQDEYYCFKEQELGDKEIEAIPVRNQVTVFGFACTQTPAMMPLPIWLAHKLSRQLVTVRRKKIMPTLTPDGKVQVGIEYRNRKPHRIHSITLVASQNRPPEQGLDTFHDAMRDAVIRPVFEDEGVKPDDRTKIFVNPYGQFFTGGGPSLHSGLTGRKNAIDTYGEYSRHSGAALSGKDPLRIDRVGAYAARYAAKNVIAAGLAEECEVQLSYSIGLSRPVSIQVETYGTGKASDEEIAARLERNMDFRLAGILRKFRLRSLPAETKGGFFRKLAAYGQVGRTDMALPWEETDKAEALGQG
ncbi:MAG: methionine adenosyltransferase [Syntrophobacteraceae bacterium]